jgi:hypothetical protein
MNITRETPSSGSDFVSVSPDVQASIHEHGLILLHTGRNLIFTSNRTGAQIWLKFTEGQSPTSIAADLTRLYGVSRAQVEEHTTAFLADLARNGILTANTGSASCS